MPLNEAQIWATIMLFLKLSGFAVGLWMIAKIVFGTFFTVEQQTAVSIERFRKFVRVAPTGLNFKIPFIDKVARLVSLEQKTLRAHGSYVTKDRASADLTVDVLHRVDPAKVFDALYRLENVDSQMQAYVSNVVRSQVAKMDLDELFSSQEDIGNQIREQLSAKFADFGYVIVATPITSVKPESKVTAAMNDINAARREQEAATARGEAEKIRVVKSAEAEAERKRQDGKGVADMASEIAKGRRNQMMELQAAGMKPDEAATLLMFLLYMETLKDSAANGKSHVIMMPSGPTAAKDTMQAIRDSVFLSHEMGHTPATA